jgi:hypothetical protein
MFLGKPGKLVVQSYEQPFAKLFTLLELAKLLEKLTLPFADQIKLPGLKPGNVLEKRTL